MTDLNETTNLPIDTSEMAAGLSMPSAFALPPLMTVQTAEILADYLRGLPVHAGTTIHLDAAAVTAISTAGIQLLVSFKKKLSLNNCSLRLQGANVAFVENLRRAGLAEFFGGSDQG